MAKNPTEMDNLIVLNDQDGREHAFNLLDIFDAGKKSFALLHPAEAPENEVTFLKVTFAKDGSIKNFEDPTEKEFAAAQEAFQEASGCGCSEDGECCGGEAGCCGGEEEAPAPKAAKAKKPAKKAAAKKPAAKKVAVKAPAAKKAAAKKPAAKKAAAKKPAAKKAGKKSSRRAA